MSEKLFRWLLFAIIALGTAVTAALVIYTAYLHAHCSIISFIANEM